MASVATNNRPEDVIRRYLETHGGKTTVPFHNLLSSWQITEPSFEDADRIDKALSDAGVQVFPPLAQAREQTAVVLINAPPRGTA